MVIGLYRHGLTKANQQRQFCGWTDVPLCEEGRKQLSRVTVPDYDWIVTSDLKRSRETAALFWTKEAAVYPAFREFHFGEWEEKTHDALQHDPAYQSWLRDYSIQVPGGESYQSFARRVESGFMDIVESANERQVKRVAIMAHGGVVRHLLTRFAPEEKPFSAWHSDNGRGFELTGSYGAIRRGARCISLQEVPLMEKTTGSPRFTS